MSRWLNGLPERWREADTSEKGQMLVVLALAMVGLLAAVGIAVDTGVLLMRQTHLARSIDAAALAGVTELSSSPDPDTALLAANIRGQQLLAANDIILEEETVAVNCADSGSPGFWDAHDYCGQRQDGATPGSYRYHAEAEWESETYFLRLVGFDTIPIRRAATAEYLTNVDLYASDINGQGLISDSNLEAFGPNCMSSYGDPYSPLQSPWHADTGGIYTFRIRIPESYIYDSLGNVNHDRLRVEVFDPDTGNATNPPGGEETVYWWLTNNSYDQETVDLGGRQQDTCLVNIGAYQDGRLDPNYDDACSPPGSFKSEPDDNFWFIRVDENRTGTAGSNSDCNTPGSYTVSQNTRTEYRLYYLEQQSDGSFQEIDLAYYEGETDGVSEGRDTDLMWVSPGVPAGDLMPSFTYDDVLDNGSSATMSATEPVTTKASCSGCEDSDGDFLIQLIDHSGRSSEMPDVYVDPATGARDIFLEMHTLDGGASENGYQIWAGPHWKDGTEYEAPAEINARQLYIQRGLMETPIQRLHSSDGVQVYGIGHLPMNRNTNARTDVALAYLGPEFAGQTMIVRVFDNIEGAKDPIYFFFDTIPLVDWAACYNQNPPYDNSESCSDYGLARLGDSSFYQGDWATYEFTIPSESVGDPDSVPFYGGRLMVSYRGGANDTFGWHITLDARPYLVE